MRAPTTTTTTLIGDDDGVFGCMSLLACHDVCPKNALPLADADRVHAPQDGDEVGSRNVAARRHRTKLTDATSSKS